MENCAILKINDRLRRFLNLKLTSKTLYFFTIKNRMYLSKDSIPANLKYTSLRAQPDKFFWRLEIPNELLLFEPDTFRVVNAPGHTIELIKKE